MSTRIVPRSFYPTDNEWETLEQALSVHTVEELKTLAAALPGATKVEGVKQQRIDRLCQLMTGASLRDLWSRLSGLQQAAVAQAVYSLDASFNSEGFRIRYGEDPDFGEKRTWGDDLEKPSLLCLFIHGRHVPLDLRQRLLDLVPRPVAPEVLAVREIPSKVETVVPPYHAGNRRGSAVKRRLPVYRSDGEVRATAELNDVLRLAEAGRIRVTSKTGRVSAPSQRLIAEVLEGGDFFAENRWRTVRSDPSPASEKTAVRTLAWPQLLTCAGFLLPRVGHLRLTAAGKKALRSPPADVLRGLWKSWRDTAVFDELRRIDELRGVGSMRRELSDLSLRRASVAQALAECPPGEWIELEAFFDHVRMAGHDFQVTRMPWELYLEEAMEQVPLDGFSDEEQWMLLQGRFIMCLLFEYMTTLGMVDVAYTSPVCSRLPTGSAAAGLCLACEEHRLNRLPGADIRGFP